MLRTDGKYKIYIIKHRYNDSGEWARSGDCTQWIPRKVVNGKNFKKVQQIFNPFKAGGECWQQTGVHGSYKKRDAVKIMDLISEWKPGHRFRVCEVEIDQKTTTIAEKKFLK